MNRDRLLELIEACRPGSDDHQHGELAELGEELARDPEARELFDEAQTRDARLAEKFFEVPVPPGLLERIEHTLAAADPPSEPSAATSLAEAVTASLETPAPAEVTTAAVPRSSRRRWLVTTISAAAAVAACVAAAVLFRPAPIHNLASLEVANRASGWESQIDAAAWQTNVPWISQQFPLPRTVGGKPFQWQYWQDPWGAQGVVYDFSPSTAPGSVLLYVSPSGGRLSDAKIFPPSQPQSSSGKLSVAVWKENEQLCVLVIHGPQSHYQQRIKPSEVALAAPRNSLLPG